MFFENYMVFFSERVASLFLAVSERQPKQVGWAFDSSTPGQWSHSLGETLLRPVQAQQQRAASSPERYGGRWTNTGTALVRTITHHLLLLQRQSPFLSSGGSRPLSSLLCRRCLHWPRTPSVRHNAS
jgi:hypothetical protein